MCGVAPAMPFIRRVSSRGDLPCYFAFVRGALPVVASNGGELASVRRASHLTLWYWEAERSDAGPPSLPRLESIRQVVGVVADVPRAVAPCSTAVAGCAFAVFLGNTVASLRSSFGAAVAPFGVRGCRPFNFNGGIHVVGALTVDEPVENLEQVGHACCCCADAYPVNGVAIPPERDAWTSEMPEGAC